MLTRPHAPPPALAPATLARDIHRAGTLAGWLDTRFKFLGYRFGFETLLGLIPGVGDTVTALLGLYPILIARRYKLGTGLQLRMGWNLFVEWVVGLIPIVGDLFDTYFKANVRNATLLEKAALRRSLA